MQRPVSAFLLLSWLLVIVGGLCLVCYQGKEPTAQHRTSYAEPQAKSIHQNAGKLPPITGDTEAATPVFVHGQQLPSVNAPDKATPKGILFPVGVHGAVCALLLGSMGLLYASLMKYKKFRKTITSKPSTRPSPSPHDTEREMSSLMLGKILEAQHQQNAGKKHMQLMPPTEASPTIMRHSKTESVAKFMYEIADIADEHHLLVLNTLINIAQARAAIQCTNAAKHEMLAHQYKPLSSIKKKKIKQ